MCYFVGSSNLSQKEFESYFGVWFISECVGMPGALEIPILTFRSNPTVELEAYLQTGECLLIFSVTRAGLVV